VKLQDNSVYHLLNLSAYQQAALRYCLYNLAQQKMISYLEFLSKRPDFSLERLGSNITEIMKQYDTMATLLSPFQGHDAFRGKVRLLMYNPNFYKFVVEAVNRYNFITCELIVGNDVATKIHYQMEKLSELVNHSNLFTFTKQEIEKASK